MGILIVTFTKATEQRCTPCTAQRVAGGRSFPISAMGGVGGMPHDLIGLIADATLGSKNGFWGCIEQGAVFKSMPGKRTQQHREQIHRNVDELDRSEHAAHAHGEAWATGEPTPCAAALDRFWARWQEIEEGEGLMVEWPTLRDLGTVPRPPGPRRRGKPRHDAAVLA